MPKFDATINGISLASYGVEPNMATVPQPEAKTYQAEIPGRDGLLDYTDAYGVVRYENRTVTIEAYEIGDITARMEHRRAICSDMHGKTCTLALTTLPGYTFTGRCSVEYDESGSETTYKLSFDCQPYMSAGERTFVGNCAGGVDLVFVSGDKPVKPRIEVPRYSIIIFNGQQYEVEAGTWTFDGVVFKRGRNEVYINTYTEPGTTTWGDLESMTWEQIGWHHRQSDASGALVNVTDALQARPNKLGVQGKSVQTVGVCGTNLVTNGDFSNGTTGWSKNLSSLSAANNELIMTITTGSEKQCRIYQIIGTIARHKYYVHGSIMRTNANNFRPMVGSNSLTLTAVANAYFTYGIVVKAIDASSYSVYLDDTVADEVIKFKNLLVIDLTAAFGAGNEPTAAQMDAYLAAYPNSWFNGSALLTTSGIPNSPSPEYPQEVDVVDSPVTVKVADESQALVNQQTITLPSDHNYLASLPDGTHDELVLHSDGVAVLVERVGKNIITGGWSEKQTVPFVHYYKQVGKRADPSKNITICNMFKNGSSSADMVYISNYGTAFFLREPSIASDKATLDAWSADNPIEYYYVLQTSNTRYSADNGATWSTTDPAAGNSAIQLYKGTNNIWCTDALSPTITLNYDTQERTRKQRVSDLYWRKNPPQKRLTWGQLATNTWAEIGSKPVQEWYYSGTADVVENAYINYEIGDL